MAPIGGAQLAVTTAWEMVTGHDDAALGQRGEKTAREDFSILNPLFLFDFPGRWDNNWKEYLGIWEKYEILLGGRLEYLGQLLYGPLRPKVNHIQMKNKNPIGAGIW
jgi:hypothetical protein